jgi:hypothetical protein
MRPAPHDDEVTSMPLPTQPELAGARPAGVASVGDAPGSSRNLEEFWPSRREHAFDEFCR